MWTTPLRAGVFTLAATVGLALTATVASASSTDLPAPTGTAPVSATGLGGAKLVNVRTGRHAEYDRTVFDFTGGTPGYRVEYGTLVSGGTGSGCGDCSRRSIISSTVNCSTTWLNFT